MVQVKGTADPAPVQMLVDPPPMAVDIDLDMTDLRTLLAVVGWPADKIDVAQAVAQAESQGGYADAVGDITLVDAKWGPSIGLFQIRSLRSPQSFGGADLWRYAFPLRQPFYNAQAALAITNGGDWSKWATFISGAYKQYLGQSPKIKTGHAQAAEWWR
jgi:hypothetical protein